MIEQYDPAKVKAQYARVLQAMQEGMRNDSRFRMLVDSCVAAASAEHGPVDLEHADHAAYEQATYAAAMLLARVYDEDGELAAMRAERDHFRAIAEQALLMSPRQIMAIPIPTDGSAH